MAAAVDPPRKPCPNGHGRCLAPDLRSELRLPADVPTGHGRVPGTEPWLVCGRRVAGCRPRYCGQIRCRAKEPAAMDDGQVHKTIEQLVAEEHELWQREAAGAGERRGSPAARGGQGLARPDVGSPAPAAGAARLGPGSERRSCCGPRTSSSTTSNSDARQQQSRRPRVRPTALLRERVTRALYMFGQLLELPECDGAVPDGVVVDGVVVATAWSRCGCARRPRIEPVAAFAIATTPPASAPVQASVASSFLVRVLMLDLLSQVVCAVHDFVLVIPVKSRRL